MIGSQKQIRVFAPATVANVGCGFDIMGFALDYPGDELVLTIVDEPGVRINTITGDEGKLPLAAEKNTAGVSLLSMVKELGFDGGVEMELHKHLPMGSGLGSSAASAVASVFAFNKLLEHPLELTDVLRFALEGERIACGTAHADNAGASLFGGFVLIRSNDPLDVVTIPTPSDLYAAVIHPVIEIRTESTRKILRNQIPLSSAVTQWGNVGGLVAGLLKSDYELIGRSLEDVVIEPVRSILIPGYDQVKAAAMEAGALGCSISGSGPSIFALTKSKKTAERVGRAMEQALTTFGLESDLYISQINQQGPRVIES